MRFTHWKTCAAALALGAAAGFVPDANQSRAADLAPMVEAKRPLDDCLWADLASVDEATAEQARKALAEAPKGEVIAFLKQRLRPVKVEEKRVAELIEDLDSPRFVIRQRAAEELEYLGKYAEPFLKKALADKPALETRRRLDQLLARFQPVPVPVDLEALEHERLRRQVEEVMRRDAMRMRRDQMLRPIRPLKPEDENAVVSDLVARPEKMPIDIDPGRTRAGSERIPEALHTTMGRASLATTPKFVVPPPLPTWRRAQEAMRILYRIGTAEAREVIVNMAEGIAEAAPTQFAQNALLSLPK